jgi:hypothetical protein
MRQRGVDIFIHRCRRLSEPILRAHSQVLAMERAQAQWIT